MKREFGQLSHWWNGSFSQIKDYYCSRKYNGWSALWDGGISIGIPSHKIPWFKKDKSVVSTGLWSLGRNNNPDVINAPPFFTEMLPKGIPLHGELWYKDRLDVIKKTCGTKKLFEPMWTNVKFMMFHIKPYSKWLLDLNHKTTTAIAEFTQKLKDSEYWDAERYEKIYGIMKNIETNDTLQLVTSLKLETLEDLKAMQKASIENRWEGLMFANPNGLYECGRSYNTLKWKGVCETEAIVEGYGDGKTGKNIGKTGSIQAHLEWGEQVLSIFGGRPDMIGEEARFNIGGLTDLERINTHEHYPIGSKIKFTFFGVSTHGVPQNCNIYRSL